jgi:hypothetical protein
MIEDHPQTPQPWWRFAHVWMVWAGPAVVVVASFFTFYLAARAPDPVLDQRGVQVSGAEDGGALTPAVQARNHAATAAAPTSPAQRP